MIGAVTIAGINKYPTTTEALEIWSSLSPVVGLITGAFVTYFFTRGAIQSAHGQARDASLLAARSQERADLTQQALVKVAGIVEPSQWDNLLNADPTIRLAIGGNGCP
jgi:hypothetical protein